MLGLARKLRLADYFALAFGAMVGVGWLVVMDDWLERGGPVGAMLGFVIGGAVLLPIGYAYGRLAMAIPDAGSEIAYTALVFPPAVSYATGWMMILAYLIVCPWEAVAIGKLAAFIMPQLDRWRLYSVAGSPVYAPRLALGLALTAALTWLNYRGIRLSADFQKWTTFGLLVIVAIFSGLGFSRGSWQNLSPAFTHGGFVSVLLMLQVVPYFMTGFEAVPKCAEEASPEFRSRGFFRAIVLALVVGVVFYSCVVAVVTHLAKWQSLTTARFVTAAAFEQAFGSRALVNLIMMAALLALLKVFNGNFIAASRLVFALGRNGMIRAHAGQVHSRNQTPYIAVLGIGLISVIATFLGDSLLVPISEVGSMASALGWLATCAAFFALHPATRERVIAVCGIVVASVLVAIKVLPFVPGHFTRYEWIAMMLWIAAGVALRSKEGRNAQVKTARSIDAV